MAFFTGELEKQERERERECEERGQIVSHAQSPEESLYCILLFCLDWL